ncbi:MAG TPA: hypothetical protein VLE19_09745, partial [Pyrinomonadaceae bacterium]|nr:hypothetical protein [Pyrinomonadaceae bacterium]
MNSPDETNESSRSAETKLGWLIVARLLTALLLFIISVLWNRAGDPQQTNSRSIKLLMIVAAFTIVY